MNTLYRRTRVSNFFGKQNSHGILCDRIFLQSTSVYISGADPGFDQGGGAQIVTGLKLPFWGLSFVEFWCWGLIFGGQGGGAGPPGPPLDPPLYLLLFVHNTYMFLLPALSNVIKSC